MVGRTAADHSVRQTLPGRPDDAPAREREPKSPYEERGRRVARTQAPRQAEVEREEERVERGEREPDRVELAERGVVRARREEAAEDRDRGGDPEASSDDAPLQASVGEQQQRDRAIGGQ